MTKKTRRNTEARRTRSKGYVGLRRGQGMYSKKTWITDLFKKVTFRRDVEDIPKLFRTKAQAERAIRRLEAFDATAKALDEVHPLMPQRAKKNSKEVKNGKPRQPPAHIVMRAAHARLWLAQHGA